MAFYQSNRYFSIFGLHYLVGYGAGAPALEAWAVAHPLRVISQVYVDSPGLSAEYLNSYAALRVRWRDRRRSYTDVVFPEGFDLIRYDETVLPTWYIHPDQRSVGREPVLLETSQRHRRRRHPARHARHGLQATSRIRPMDDVATPGRSPRWRSRTGRSATPARPAPARSSTS